MKSKMIGTDKDLNDFFESQRQAVAKPHHIAYGDKPTMWKQIQVLRDEHRSLIREIDRMTPALAQHETDMKAYSARHLLQLSVEVDGGNVKKFSNEKVRQAELVRRLAGNPEYGALLGVAQSIEDQLRTATAELSIVKSDQIDLRLAMGQ